MTMTMTSADPQKPFTDEVSSVDEFGEQIQEPRSHFYMNSAERKPVLIDDNIIDDHWVMDLHGGNYMLRGDIIVIADPISHKYAC
ncbi:hypothetical protein ACVBIL_14685 [Shewanella sp. 125m-7]